MISLRDIIFTSWFFRATEAHQRFLLAQFDPVDTLYMNSWIRWDALYSHNQENTSLRLFVADCDRLASSFDCYVLWGGISWKTGREMSLQFHWKKQRFGHIYCRISDYGNFYWLSSYLPEGDDQRILLDLIPKVHSLLRDQYSLMEISIDDPLLDHPLEVFGEKHGAPMFSPKHQKFFGDTPITWSEEGLFDYFGSITNGLLLIPSNDPHTFIKQAYQDLLQGKDPGVEILVNSKNEPTNRRFNVRDLLFGEFW